MSFYNKSTNFAVKDSLTTGDPNKIVSGVEIDTEFTNIASGFSSVDSSVSSLETSVSSLETSLETSVSSLESLQNSVHAVKQDVQSVSTSSSANTVFFEVDNFSPSISITIPSDRSSSEIEILAIIAFEASHSSENDCAVEFALTESTETGGLSTITAIARSTYEYEIQGASSSSNTLKGTATLRARVSPGAGSHTYKIFARNVRAAGTQTVNIQGSTTEQNSTVVIREIS